jgi:hypothetical protein
VTQQQGSAPGPQLTRWEVLGAWLGIWTAPKGIDVPPRPTAARLGIWGAAALVVVGGTLAAVVPRLEDSKRATAAQAARAQARAAAAEQARLRRDQRVRRARVPAGAAPVAALERAITRDTRARVARGELHGSVGGTRCEASSAASARYPASRVYRCVTYDRPRTGAGSGITTGYSFVATIYTRARSIAWCKHNPQAGIAQPGGTADQAGHVRLSPVCAGRLADLL